VGSAAFSSFA